MESDFVLKHGPDGSKQRIHDLIATLGPWDLLYLRRQTETSEYSQRITLSSIDALPQELVADIFYHLPMADLFSCLQVSRAWRLAWSAPDVLRTALARIQPDLYISPKQETDFASFKRIYTEYAERFLNPSSNLRSITFWTFQSLEDPRKRIRGRLHQLPPLVYHEGMFAWQPESSYVLIQDIDASCTYKCTYGKKTIEGTVMQLVGVSKDLLIFSVNSRELHIWHIRLNEWKKVNLPAQHTACTASRSVLVVIANNKETYRWTWGANLEELSIDRNRLVSLANGFSPILGGSPAAIVDYQSNTTALIWVFKNPDLGDRIYGFVAGTYELGKEPTYTSYCLEHDVAVDTLRTCTSILICEPRKLNNNGTYVIATINQEMRQFRRGVKPLRTSRYVCFNIHTGRFMYLNGDEDEDSPNGIYRVYGSRNQELDMSTESEAVGGNRGRLGPSNGAFLHLEAFGYVPTPVRERGQRRLPERSQPWLPERSRRWMGELRHHRLPELRNRVACWSNMRLFRKEGLAYWTTPTTPQQVRASPVTNRRWLPGSTIFSGQEMHSSGCDLDTILALPEPYSTLALTNRLHYPKTGACHEAVFMDETGIVIAGNNSFVTSRWPTSGERTEGRRGGYLGKAFWEANAGTMDYYEASDIVTDYDSDASGDCKVFGGRLINSTERYTTSLRQVGWLEAILNEPVTLCESPQHIYGGGIYDIDENVLVSTQRGIPSYTQEAAQEATDESSGSEFNPEWSNGEGEVFVSERLTEDDVASLEALSDSDDDRPILRRRIIPIRHSSQHPDDSAEEVD